MRTLAFAAAALLALAPAAAPAAPGAAPMKVIQRIPGPDGGWDYVSFDAARRRVYFSHGNVVLSLDVDSGKLNPAFAPGAGLHAIVPVPGTDVLVTTNRGDSSAKIIKASDGSLVKSLPVGADADGAGYDPATRLVVVINGDPGDLTLVDPRKEAVVGVIHVGDHLEFGASDGKGKFFVNVENTGEVAAVDLKTRKVLGRFKMTGCVRPTGLAAVEGDRIISACNSGMAKILDSRTGRELASVKIGGFADSVQYDPEHQLAFVPTARDGVLSVIALSGKRNNTVVAEVPTQVGARTGAVDPKTGRVYLPTADYNPLVAGQRPTTKPGTFTILVVGRE
jgi:DNA-binding beta-propeller fold protein YncE